MILARHAESLFWVGRYLERAETTARMLNLAGSAVIYQQPAEAERRWQRLIDVLAVRNEFEAASGRLDQRNISAFLVSGETNPGSVDSCVRAMRENLRVVRDRVPVELWEEASLLQLRLRTLDVGHVLDAEPHEIYQLVREGCQAISGVIAEAMDRDDGHAFIVIGRMIERATLTTRVLAEAWNHPAEEFDGDRLLRATSSLQAYLRDRGQVGDHMDVTRFLLTTDHVPRSVIFCVQHAEQRVAAIALGPDGFGSPVRSMGRLRAKLEFDEIITDLTADPLATLRSLERDLIDIADSISARMFRPHEVPTLHAQYVRPGRDDV